MFYTNSSDSFPPLVDTRGCIHATVSASDLLVSSTEDPNLAGTEDAASDNEYGKGEQNSQSQLVADSIPPVLAATCQLFLHLAGQIDVILERQRTEERLKHLNQSIQALYASRSLPEYTSKVPVTKRLADERKVSCQISALIPSYRPVQLCLQDVHLNPV